MASSAKMFARLAARSSPLTSTLRTNSPALLRRQARGYANGAGPSSSSYSKGLYVGLGLGAAVAGGGYYVYTQPTSPATTKSSAPITAASAAEPAGKKSVVPTTDLDQGKKNAYSQKDYQEVYNEIARRLEEKDDYDDGSYGPVLVRLAWHCSGTYDKETGTGGSNGATMRFPPEGDHGANAGLKSARNFMEPVKRKRALSIAHPFFTQLAIRHSPHT